MMKVILLENVKKVGKKDQTVDVSDGYATNYLIPHKLAVPLTKKSLEVLDTQKQIEKDNQEKAKSEALVLKSKLEGIVIEIPIKSGKDGKLFGNVSLKRVEEELLNKYQLKIDKRKFIDKGTLDTLGYFKLKIELYKGVIGLVNVHIIEEVK